MSEVDNYNAQPENWNLIFRKMLFLFIYFSAHDSFKMCVIEETKECPCDSESQVYIIDYFGQIVNLFSYNFDRNVIFT